VIGIAVRGDGPCDELVRALEPLRSDAKAEHNYSVWFSDDPQVFQRLQWGGCNVVRTRDPNRFARALALHLSGHGAPTPGLVRADGIAAVHDGGVTILPAALRQSMATYERPLRDAGVILHDAPWVDVDPAASDVVLEAPKLPAARFDDVVKHLPASHRPDPAAEPGRYRLAGWYFATVDPGGDPMSQADAVGTVLSRLGWPLTQDDQPEALTAVFERTPFDYIRLGKARDLLDKIGR
jgi:hypothetical protein